MVRIKLQGIIQPFLCSHIIAGKEKTHEIFFSVFNDLVNNRKQICLSADKAPSEIKGLEERIISRFNQGLTINIEAPEYETAVNILKMKINNDIGSSSSSEYLMISYEQMSIDHVQTEINRNRGDYY